MRPDGLEVDLVVEQLRRLVPGGIGTYCRGLVGGLLTLEESEAPELRLVASRPRRSSEDAVSALGLRVVTSLLPGPLLTRSWDHGLAAGYLGTRRRPSLVHACSLAVPPLWRTPVVVTVHDLAWRVVPEAFPPRGRRWHEAALLRAKRRAALVVAPSRLTAEALEEAGFRSSQVRVIEEGADHLPPPDDEGARKLLSSCGVVPEEGFVLSVATLEPRKNLARLVEAFKSVREELVGASRLVVVGPAGWGESAVLSDDHVLAVGTASGGVLAALYEKARCVAYVPLLEGFGLPAAEAMMAGAPVVASRQLPSTNGAAVEVEPTDVDSIAEGLRAACADSEERSRALSLGAKRASELTWRRAAARHVEAWAELAGRRAA